MDRQRRTPRRCRTCASSVNTTHRLQGAGGVYRLELAKADVKKKLLHAFDPASEGNSPDGELTADARDNLVGILSSATQPGAAGAVFELEQRGKSYVFHLLHTFGLVAGGGRTPVGRLAVDASGNVYGATQYGGQSGVGRSTASRASAAARRSRSCTASRTARACTRRAA